ncbi:sulfotransferase 1E1-like [Glandiceps talaboti]
MAAANKQTVTPDNYWVRGYYCPNDFVKEKVEKFASEEVLTYKEGDVIVNGFMKSGTTWLSHVVMNMYDDWGVCKLDGVCDASCLEWTVVRPDIESIRPAWRKALAEQIDAMPSPRLFRSHFPYEVMRPQTGFKERKVKVIYIARNPKDLCVSWYYFGQEFVKGTWAAANWDETVPQFVEGKVYAGPYHKHLIAWRKLGEDDNVLHVTYEEMKADIAAAIRKIAEFLGRPLKEEKIQQVVETTSFDSMKSAGTKVAQSQEVKNFMRKGIIGDWKSYFTVAQNEYFDREVNDTLKENGIEFREIEIL